MENYIWVCQPGFYSDISVHYDSGHDNILLITFVAEIMETWKPAITTSVEAGNENLLQLSKKL